MLGNIGPALRLLPVLLVSMMFATPSMAGVSELRGGIYAHDVFGPAHEKDNADINAEILFESPSFLSWAYAPRPRLGGTLSGNGGTSHVYLDLGWTVDFTDTVFLDFSVGGALHDGSLKTNDPHKNEYGCRANFHESISLGYRFAPAWSMMVSLEHISNAGLCKPNDGLTNLGVRLGYAF